MIFIWKNIFGGVFLLNFLEPSKLKYIKATFIFNIAYSKEAN